VSTSGPVNDVTTFRALSNSRCALFRCRSACARSAGGAISRPLRPTPHALSSSTQPRQSAAPHSHTKVHLSPAEGATSATQVACQESG
jgi:hypothetical protein